MDDKDAFGHWLSGFTDGEGCFFLKCRQDTVVQLISRFVIGLRGDDRPVLETVRSYLGVGQVTVVSRPKGKTLARYIAGCRVSYPVIINQFEAYPLRAKKAADFLIWREASLLIMNRSPGSRYTSQELTRFAELAANLKTVREFTCPTAR